MNKAKIAVVTLSSLAIVAYLLCGIGFLTAQQVALDNASSLGVHYDTDSDNVVIENGSSDEGGITTPNPDEGYEGYEGKAILYLDDNKVQLVGELKATYVGEETSVDRYYTIEMSSELDKYVKVSESETFKWEDGKPINPQFEFKENMNPENYEEYKKLVNNFSEDKPYLTIKFKVSEGE